MLRKLLGAGAALTVMLAGCREPKGACDTDADCGSGQTCDAQAKLCFLTVTQFTGFEFVYPQGLEGAVRSGPVKLRARLVPPASDAAPNFPQTVGFKVSQAGTVLAEGVLTHTGEGNYEGDWTAPGGDGVYELTLSYDEASLSETKQFRTDNTKPRFAVTVPPADAGTPSATTTYADPQLPNAWRRDQVVSISVTADEPVVANSVKLIVHGLDAGTAVEEFPVTQSATCASKFCGVAAVDLAKPGMNAFRGNFPLEVRGADVAGNENAIPDAGVVPVTRWKWAFDGNSGDIRTTPAIGAEGVVYFGTTTNTDGKLFALLQDGTLRWPAVTVGAVAASPAIGQSRGSDVIFVSGKPAAGTTLYAFHGASGAELKACPYPTATVNAATALITTQAGGIPVESAIFILDGYRSAVALRPIDSIDSNDVDWDCVASNANTNSPAASTGIAGSLPILSSVVGDGNRFYYPTSSNSVVGFSFGSTAPFFTASTSNIQAIFGLAMVGANVVGAGGLSATQGGLYVIPKESTGTPSIAPLSGTPSNRVFNVIVGGSEAASTAYFGAETSNSSDLKALRLAQPTNVTPVVDAKAFPTAAALGRGGVLFTAGGQGAEGEVTARSSSTLAKLWSVSAGFSSATGSLALDCARDGTGSQASNNLGVLYVPAGTKLHAVVVDSPGLDRDAAWPKHQHDARNTGNPATPITDCR